MSQPLRVLLVEDEPLFRGLIVDALGDHPEVTVVGDFASGEETLTRAADLSPDVALLDIELEGDMSGVDLGLRLRDALPELGIVLLSAHDDPSLLTALPQEQAGGWSYLLKSSVRDLDSVVRAMRGAVEGNITLDPDLTRARRVRTGGRLDQLTPRQREILQLVAEGLSNAAIAERLVLAQKSVENYINALFVQLGVDSGDRGVAARVQAARIYIEETW